MNCYTIEYDWGNILLAFMKDLHYVIVHQKYIFY